jgi:hypothetical protein
VADLDVIAALPGAVFATLIPKTGPTEAERHLATVSEDSAAPLSDLKARLARDANAHSDVGYAARICTRADNGAFYPHLHAVVVGIADDRLRVLAEAAGLSLAYAAPLLEPEAAAHYIASRKQSKYYDAIEGVRPFFARLPKALPAQDAHPAPDADAQPAPQDALVSDLVVPKRHTEPADPRAALEALANNPPSGPIPIPGGTIADPALFIRTTLADLDHKSPAVRAAAESNTLTFLRALGHGGDP